MTSVIDAAPAKPAFRLTRAFQGLERVVVPALLIAGWETFARSGVLPLAIIWFGIADKPAIFLVFLGAFFPVLMNSIHGVKTVDHNLVRAGAMMGASQRQMLTDIVLPAALPSIFAGLRIAVGSAWMLTVTAAMVGATSGR